jgi:hypothetical protein
MIKVVHINSTTLYGETPLYLACLKGNSEFVIKELLNRGADPLCITEGPIGIFLLSFIFLSLSHNDFLGGKTPFSIALSKSFSQETFQLMRLGIFKRILRAISAEDVPSLSYCFSLPTISVNDVLTKEGYTALHLLCQVQFSFQSISYFFWTLLILNPQRIISLYFLL